MKNRFTSALFLSTSAFAALSAPVSAQETAAMPGGDPTLEAQDDGIVVVGTQIQGAQINDVLPVTVLDEQAIENTGAASGDELFRAIPQAGTVAFNEQNSTTQNSARGDVGSINLRDLGTGNTLLLINGRRMTLHPGFQTELLVPVVSSDTNEISPGSVKRLEVLRDGASAIYGADAVAGVINTVLKSNMKGGFIEGDWRASDGTSLYSYQFSGGYGFDFGDGRGNLTVYGGYFHENGLPASERYYAGEEDRRPLVVGTPFEGDASFNNRNTYGPFGQFDIQAPSSRTPIGDDDFYLQPDYFPNCRLDFGNGLCARAGTTPTTDVRYNTNFGNSLISAKNRYNAMALFNYELTDNIEAYVEGSYYRSENRRKIEASAILSAVPVGIAATAYYNPFGPVGSPNRLPGTTIAAGGADVIMERYRFVDVGGNRDVSVDKDTYRIVSGLRGNFGAWDFDTGLLYSEATSLDLARNRVSLTLMQNQINLTTPDAYNPFNGGCVTGDPGKGDCTPNPESSIAPFRIDVFRKGGTSLALADFKVSRDDLFVLPGGDLGIAAGVEFRRETFFDDRDPRLDGTITFTDSVTGEFNGSDVAGTSPSPDTNGTRDVYSSFAELFVPVVSPDMDIPLVESFNVQLAGRIEHFKDINATATVPRIATSWTVFPGVTFRGAWSQGFRAPNLVQVNDDGTTRSNTRDDFVQCQAMVEKGTLSGLDSCPGAGVISYRSGARNLKPEDSDSINLGVVLEPEFIPGLTFTADYWRVEQRGLVGTFGDDNAIALDLLLRLNGSSNPNVIRDTPTPEQIALFDNTTFKEPAGKIIQVLDPYLNLDSRRSKGLDFGLYYDLPDFGAGDFSMRFNAARLLGFVQSAGPDGQLLVDAIAAGLLPQDVTVGGLGELLEIEGRPKWRFSGSMNWQSNGWNLGLFGNYIGGVWDTSVVRDDLIVSDDPNANYFRVDDVFTLNASVSYTIKNDTALNGTRLRFAINNVFDTDPPLADETYGYFSELHSARGRVFHVELRKKF